MVKREEREVLSGATDEYADALVDHAIAAQRTFQSWSEEATDRLLQALARCVYLHAEELAVAAVQETGMGNVMDKTIKNRFASRDIYRSLEILAKHPRVDPDRIVLMGFSRGGQAALYASLDRFQKLWNKSGAQFAAYIPFYPDCSTSYATDTETVARPIRIYHGTPDDYNPVATCKAFVARLQEEKRDVTLTEYPDSQHGFDAGLLGVSSNVMASGAQTVRNCKIRESEGGVLINTETQAPFGYKDACVETNPHVGGNPATAEAARKAVSDFLQVLFKLS